MNDVSGSWSRHTRVLSGRKLAVGSKLDTLVGAIADDSHTSAPAYRVAAGDRLAHRANGRPSSCLPGSSSFPRLETAFGREVLPETLEVVRRPALGLGYTNAH